MRQFLTPSRVKKSPLKERSLHQQAKAHRIQNRHMKKIDIVVKKHEENNPNPELDQMSRSLSVKRNLKKNYSHNVFERLNQETEERMERKEELKRRRTQEEGAFQPALCPKSMRMARNARERAYKKEQESTVKEPPPKITRNLNKSACQLGSTSRMKEKGKMTN